MLSNRGNTRIHSFKLFPENSTILSWLVTKCTLFTWWQIAQLSALNEHILLLVNWEGGILIASVEWHCTMLCINNGRTLTFVQNVGNLHTEHTHQAPDKPFTERNLIVDCKRCLLSFQSPCCPADLGNLLQTGNCCQNWFISDQGVWLMMACFERTLQFCTKIKVCLSSTRAITWKTPIFSGVFTCWTLRIMTLFMRNILQTPGFIGRLLQQNFWAHGFNSCLCQTWDCQCANLCSRHACIQN